MYLICSDVQNKAKHTLEEKKSGRGIAPPASVVKFIPNSGGRLNGLTIPSGLNFRIVSIPWRPPVYFSAPLGGERKSWNCIETGAPPSAQLLAGKGGSDPIPLI